MASCNGCSYLRLKRRLSDRFLVLPYAIPGWTSVYELGAEPAKGQVEPLEHNGQPIRFYAAYASIGHSRDEDCDSLDKKGW